LHKPLTMKNILSVLLIAATLGTTAQVSFVKTTDLNALLKQAKQEHRLIFIDAYTDWCGWCKELDKQVFATKEAGDAMAKNFIATKLEMEKDSIGIMLTRKFGTSAYPTALILDGDGNLVHWIEGYAPKEKYIGLIHEAADPSNHVKERGYSTRFDISYPSFYLEAIPMKGKRKMPDSVEVNRYVRQAKDLSAEVTWAVVKKFYFMLDAEQYKRVLANEAALRNTFGSKHVEAVAQRMIDQKISQCTREKNFRCVEEHLATLKRITGLSDETRNLYIEHFYETNRMWNELKAHVQKQLAQPEYINNHSHLNDLAWSLYEHCDNRDLLNMATTWMQPVIAKEPVYMYLDTYAALLHKTNRKEEAKKYALEAIETGKKSGADVSETEKLLKKIEGKN
jgi:thioredoxin-related protein